MNISYENAIAAETVDVSDLSLSPTLSMITACLEEVLKDDEKLSLDQQETSSTPIVAISDKKQKRRKITLVTKPLMALPKPWNPPSIAAPIAAPTIAPASHPTILMSMSQMHMSSQPVSMLRAVLRR